MSRPAGSCAGCGARMLGVWRVCPRCGHALAHVPPPSARAKPAPPDDRRGVSRHLALAVAAIGVVVVAVLIWQLRPGEPPETSGALEPEALRRPVVQAEAPAERPDLDLPRAPETTGEAAQRGLRAYADGDLTAALAAFQEAVGDQPRDAESLNNLGQVLIRLGRVPEALPRFEQAIDLSPSKWAFRFNHARALGLTGNWQAAVEGYREADRLFPDDYVTLFNMGLALQKLGLHREAAPVLERASQLDQDASLLLPLGASYEALTRTAEAVDVYQRYLAAAAEGPDAPAVRARLERLTESPTGGAY